MNLPKNTYTFTFREKGEKTKKTYEGTFVVKCLLTALEVGQVAINQDVLNGGVKNIPSGVAILNRALAELDVRIEKAPSFWKDANNGRDLMDLNIILEVYNKALDAETDYEKRINEEAEQAEKAIEEAKSKKSAQG